MIIQTVRSARVQWLVCFSLLVISLATIQSGQCAEEKHNNNENKSHAASIGASTTLAPVAHVSHATASLKAPAVRLNRTNVNTHDPAGTLPAIASTFPPDGPAQLAGIANASFHSTTTVQPVIEVPALAMGAGAKNATVVVTAMSAAPAGPASKLAAYFEPICAELDKLQAKQMFKIQSQMKQFVERTAGKLSLCFMQHYSIDPNLTPVNKAQLGAICSSRALASGARSAFESFQACAELNWDKNLDLELERINRLRENCVKNHPHSKTDSMARLSHDDENEREASLISEVLGKVFGANQAAVNKTDIKVVDVGTRVAVGPSAATSSVATSQPPSKQILSDPNTMVIFVDEPSRTTAAPPRVVAKPPVPGTNATLVLVASNAPTKRATVISALASGAGLATVAPVAATTTRPAVGAASISVTFATTAKPTTGVWTTSRSALSGLGDKILSAVDKMESGKQSGPNVATPSAKPIAKDPSTTRVAIVGSSTTTSVPNTTVGPSSTPKTGTSSPRPQTTGPPKTTSRASTQGASSAPKLAGKKMISKEETDAKNAIRALQLQRAQKSHVVSDAHMHQIEHQRQMAIDPIGHTIKHQQYEQRKAAAAAAAAARRGH